MQLLIKKVYINFQMEQLPYLKMILKISEL